MQATYFDIVRRHLPSAHCYADDTQLYISFNPNDSDHRDNAMKAMESCVCDVKEWMKNDRLLLNADKTEFIIIGTRQQLDKISLSHLNVGTSEVRNSFCVKNLSSWFDNHLNMNEHIAKTRSAAFFFLHNLRRICKYLSQSTTETLVHALITGFPP